MLAASTRQEPWARCGPAHSLGADVMAFIRFSTALTGVLALWGVTGFEPVTSSL
jgi:hypothetical protein